MHSVVATLRVGETSKIIENYHDDLRESYNRAWHRSIGRMEKINDESFSGKEKGTKVSEAEN
jgi:hypothetical protein